MEWNRKLTARRREPVIFADPDPEYTLPKGEMLRMFKWNWKHLKAAEQQGFPKAKQFARNAVMYHPQQVNDWLAARNGNLKVGSWKP